MRLRSFIGILFGLAVVVVASFLTQQNRELIQERVHFGEGTTFSLWLVVLGVFLLGLLPPLIALLAGSVRRDLALRGERRQQRDAESLDRSFNRAVDFQADGQWARAAAELEAVLAGRPEDFSSLVRYGEVLRRLGRVDEALDVHRRASACFPRSVAVLYQLTEDYEVRGEAEVAREIRNRVLREFPGLGLDVLRRRRNAALGGRQWAIAADLQERIDTLLAEARGETGGPALVEAKHEVGVRRGLDYQRGVAALEDDRIEEAIERFERLLAQESRFIPAAIMLGEAELVRDHGEKALEVWLRGYAETGSPIFLQRIEDYFIKSNQPRRAIETLRRLIAEADHGLLLRFFLGRLYYRLEMHDDALKVLEGLSEPLAVSPTFHFLIGRIRQRRGENTAALAAFQTCAQCVGVPEVQFQCKVCRTTSSEWSDRCAACGSWNSMELRLEEALSAEELGLRESPAWVIPPQWVPEEVLTEADPPVGRSED